MEKDFESWHKVKAKLQKNRSFPSFREREIWWCSLGVNIGDEEDGKGENSRRPVLIIRKFNKRIFWAVPLTTQIKESRHYHKITFNNKTQCAMVTQLKLLDSKRLTSKMGQLPKDQVTLIQKVLIDLMSGIDVLN